MALLEKYMTAVKSEGTYVVVDTKGAETTNLQNTATVTLASDPDPDPKPEDKDSAATLSTLAAAAVISASFAF